MRQQRFNINPLSAAVLGAAVVICAGLFMYVFRLIPIGDSTLALDWKLIQPGLTGGWINYRDNIGLVYPPWSLVFMLPLGFFGFRESWGLINFIAVAVLLLSVPRVRPRWLYWASAVLLVVSFPTLRLLADGNFDAIAIMGILIVLYAYRKENAVLMAIGLLLATIKPQLSFLFMLVLGWYILRTWKVRSWIMTGAICLAVMIPTVLLLWEDWMANVAVSPRRGWTIDISLASVLYRVFDAPDAVILVVQLAVVALTLGVALIGGASLHREKVGMLIAGSMLAAPYTGGNGLLVVLAIGIIPFFQKKLLLGFALLILMNLPFFVDREAYIDAMSYFGTAELALWWLVLMWRTYSVGMLVRQEKQPEPNPQVQPAH